MKVTNSINASMRRGSLRVLPDDILEKIVEKYKTIFNIKYKLKDWIPPKKIVWEILSKNPNAIELLKTKINEENEMSEDNYGDSDDYDPNNIDWKNLSLNPAAIELLRENQDNIYWKNLSLNPAAIELLRENQDNIYWDELSANPAAIELLKTYPKFSLLNLIPNSLTGVSSKHLLKNAINNNSKKSTHRWFILFCSPRRTRRLR